MPHFIYWIMIFLSGTLIGSFLNVCICRLPRHESVIVTRSHCMTCGAVIRNRDLIPIISYLLLGGRCRVCGIRISIQYPLIELINGILYVIIFAIRGLPTVAVTDPKQIIVSTLYCLAASALLVLSVIDFRTYEIPVRINLFLLMIGVVRMGLDLPNWNLYFIGFLSISTTLYLIFLVSGGKAIGGGDVKLMAAAGLLLGWRNILLAFFLGCLIGSILHVIRMKISHADRVLAMGPYLSLGILLAMLYGERLWNWYMEFFI